MKAVMYSDGGARGNPGPAGCGAVVLGDDGEVLAEVSKYIGTATNNVAEYTAIILGLEAAKAIGVKSIEARMDSELACKQLKGEYKVKNQDLARLFVQVKSLEHSFESIRYTHVRRERNSHADALVNKAIDEALG